ncbi:triacylglycerol lipase OBL1-like [Rhododendron vialii]|uniref:triacylglycerol lipase OBL1-like n=1 Tax=Rhododendron vialii TaxID=182163 RepID=UPI00265FD604|nr:triacylglycerol lipase OBL1-like [Rhododendron vialii]
MDCDGSNSFSKNNYMILRPDEIDVFDLVGVLFSSDLEKRKGVHCQAWRGESFQRRWIIFVSISMQKFLRSVAKPMACFGSVVEMWLNLLSCNHNFSMLLLNILQGKVVMPDKNSATFLSFIGNLDKRVELDKNIKHGDIRYYGALSMMASKASYENKAYIETTVNDLWKMEFLGAFSFWNDYQEKATTQAFMFRDKNASSDLIIVAFRGTEAFDADAWCTDFDISWYELPGKGKVHGGFMKALGMKKNQGWPKEIEQDNHNQPPGAYYAIREKLRDLLQTNDEARFILTGHSLGGALAILFAAVLAMHEEVGLLGRLEGVYTFGQPRVGDEKFGEFMTTQLEKYTIPYNWFVYSNDMVPRLPYDDSTLMFKHFGTCLYFNSFYQGKIVTEEPNKNYFSPLAIIPKAINGIWELMRSFIIPHTMGPDYKEGFVLRLLRSIGLVIAGVSAHSTQDYVNATRLSSPHVYSLVYHAKKHQ